MIRKVDINKYSSSIRISNMRRFVLQGYIEYHYANEHLTKFYMKIGDGLQELLLLH